MNEKKINQAAEKAKVLDQETRHLLDRAKRNNTKATTAFVICWSVLLIIGVIGIYQQNQIAQANKEHIDCIVKLLATPIQPGQTRRIIDLSTCQIKVGP